MARYNEGYDMTTPARGVNLAPPAPRQVMPTPTNPTPGFRRPQSYPTTAQTPYGQAGYQAPQFPGFKPTNEFAQDPTTRNFEQLMNFQIPYYMQPVQQQNYLAGTSGAYGQFTDTLNNILGQVMGGPSAGEAGLMSAFNALMGGGGNADAYANEYRNQLKVDPYSGAEGEAYQTEFMDPLASQRDQAVARTMREISDQGIDPSSGIAQAKLAITRGDYDKAAAGAQNKMAIARNQQRQQRQGLAFQAGLSAEELKQRGFSAAGSLAGGAANAWNNRLGLGANVAGMGNDAAMQRASMGYSQDRATRAEQYQNFDRAMQLSQIMSNLPAQRQMEALQLMQGSDPSNMMNMTNAEAGQRVNSAQVANNAYANTWGGLGSMLGYFGQMFPTSGGGGNPMYGDSTIWGDGLPPDDYGGYGSYGGFE